MPYYCGSYFQGHPEYIYGLAETMGWVIERDAAFWIAQQGGWVRF